MRFLRTRLTYANVMATLAIFVALGGTSYAAAKIGSTQIKDGSVQGKDIKNSSVTSADVKNGSLVSRDFRRGQLPRGPVGATGATGATGAAGAAGSTNVVVRAITNDCNGCAGFSAKTVSCQPGERATGGGAVLLNTAGTELAGAVASDNLAYSGPAAAGRPAAEGEVPTGWASKIQVGNSATPRLIRYYAVCASP